MMLGKIARTLKSLTDVTIITHVNPDGDALGSSFALKKALNKLNINAEVVLEKPLSPDFKFTSWNPIVYNENMHPNCVIGVDFNDPKRAGECFNLFEKAETKMIVDHHICDSATCDLFYCDHKSAAAGEIIYSLTNELGVEIDKEIAMALYISIMSDTGGCRFGNTTSKTHMILSKIIELVDVAYICRMLFDITPLRKIELSNKILSNIEFFADGKIGVVTAENVQPEDEHLLNDMANRALNIEGCEIGAFFKQRSGEVKVSLRTFGKINASEICKKFGGGGHKNASGCTICKPLSVAKEEFIRELIKWIQ